VIKQDTSENLVKIVYLGIGSNLGNKKRYIETAKLKLLNYQIEILKCSSNYESEAWPDPKQPKFINIIVKIKTTLSPFGLLKICNFIEKELGRKRLKKNSPRTCDIDIIDFNQIILNDKRKNITIPHQSLTQRNFVLLPLFEINQSWKHPKTRINIVKLISSLPIRDLRSIKQI
jgi:2-amino-4-hydroxy-6-hydroxymethyldihydropteridine diphosphokinase